MRVLRARGALMPSPRNLYIPKDWDEAWPEVAAMRAAYAVEDALWPDWGGGSPREVLSAEEYERFQAAYDEHSRLRADHPAWVLHPPLVMPWWVWDGKDPFHPFGNATDQELAETGWKGLGL